VRESETTNKDDVRVCSSASERGRDTTKIREEKERKIDR